jgi:plasmid stabilization system protein ParE
VPKLRLHPEAEQDLYRDAAWYDQHNPGLGDRFLAEVLNALDRVLEAPEQCPLHPHIANQPTPPIRRVLVDTFPYSIAYQVFSDELLVLAVAHAKRHPLYWTSRTQ